MSEEVIVPSEFTKNCETPIPLVVRIIVQVLVSFVIYVAGRLVLELASISTKDSAVWNLACMAPSVVFMKDIYAYIRDTLRDCFARDTYRRLWSHYSKDIDADDRERIVTDMTRNAVYQHKLQRKMSRRYHDHRYSHRPGLHISTGLGSLSM